jgi:hypothetical protein
MLKWYKTFDGLTAERIPLYDHDDYHLVINFQRGYECVDGSWAPGYFFVGIRSKKPLYGNLFVDDMDHIKSAKEAMQWVWKFTGFPHASQMELQRIIDTNGDLPELDDVCRKG